MVVWMNGYGRKIEFVGVRTIVSLYLFARYIYVYGLTASNSMIISVTERHCVNITDNSLCQAVFNHHINIGISSPPIYTSIIHTLKLTGIHTIVNASSLVNHVRSDGSAKTAIKFISMADENIAILVHKIIAGIVNKQSLNVRLLDEN